ncbi:chemotaxis-specific protein-glutamate methyltransferase CheB [Deinococcus roseus]|uniref:Protein-glutamate methylesterase/protein-glutamine glutaminase n=1 Tax=Deinococcus roseus TaxID=392414 RepID=A0ABQ2D0I3_9DEIO|nr:chemotaxis-specific protein-glutamate methyltransferase CheB [Deinococcus roseus]GGJ39237.1 chemotaxis response regulator protein-glutamate methylesterase [Deinococcus roseus]
MKPLKVLIVDDSPVQLAMLRNWIEQDPEMKVVGMASGGQDALRLTAELHPDVIAIDMIMPEMDGFRVTERIMQEHPTPILLLTVSEQHATMSKNAHHSGAITLMLKPSPDDPLNIQKFRQTLKAVSKIKMVRRNTVKAPSTPTSRPAAPYQAVLIASSTGGPPILQTVLSRLPDAFPLPILIVQHIAQGFEMSLLNWLQTSSALPIQLAREGMEVQRGVYLAPSGTHLELLRRQGKLTLHLSNHAPIKGHRPSANILFESGVRTLGGNLMAIQLTGMGDDGATGMKAIRDAGGFTIAQDEKSSAVFGMPQAAIKLGGAQFVLSPEEIPRKLKEVLGLF